MERIQITYRGHVQGVGFRATARAVANNFRVTGWVRNEPDGTVLLEVQGTAEEVTNYSEALREHIGRLIEGEDSRRATPQPEERGFEVRR